MLYLWILKIVKHIILKDYYSILKKDKIKLKRSDKYVVLSNIRKTVHGKLYMEKYKKIIKV